MNTLIYQLRFLVLVLCLGMICHVFGACKSSLMKNDRSHPPQALAKEELELSKVSLKEIVKIYLMENNKRRVVLKLSNESDHDIFVTYEHDPKIEDIGHVFNCLQKVEPGHSDVLSSNCPHGSGKLTGLSPQKYLLFKPYGSLNEEGEYRVSVIYFSTAEASQIVNSKLPWNWSADEKRIVSEARKIVYSDSFTVKLSN
jgi:hypothetical protein